jgi:hypothetical protein
VVGLCLFPCPRGKGETLRHKHSRSKKRRNVTILALCGSFAVIPVLSLLHRPSTGIAIANAAARSASKNGVGRRLSARSSRADGRTGAFTALAEADSPLSVTSIQRTVVTASSVVAQPSIVAARNAQRSISSAAVRGAVASTTAKPVPVRVPPTPPSVVSAPPSVTTTTTAGSAHVEYGAATWLDTIPTGTCANNEAPMGSTILVTTATGATAFCRVVSRGPFAVGRIVDVAKATFALLAPPSQGVVNVRVSW